MSLMEYGKTEEEDNRPQENPSELSRPTKWLSIPATMWRGMYGVFLKKVLHKREEKIQEKMKMTSQRDENLVQHQCRVYFCSKLFFKP